MKNLLKIVFVALCLAIVAVVLLPYISVFSKAEKTPQPLTAEEQRLTAEFLKLGGPATLELSFKGTQFCDVFLKGNPAPNAIESTLDSLLQKTAKETGVNQLYVFYRVTGDGPAFYRELKWYPREEGWATGGGHPCEEYGDRGEFKFTIDRVTPRYIKN